jgi:hypothetical protein
VVSAIGDQTTTMHLPFLFLERSEIQKKNEVMMVLPSIELS